MALEKRVVIVGGGILGAAAAHALNRRGETDVLLLERMGPAAGASGVGAGILCHATWDPRNIRLIRRSLEVYEAAARDPDPVAFPYHRTGGATVVGPDQADAARRILRLLGNADVDAQLLEAEEARDLPGLGSVRLEEDDQVLRCPLDGWGIVTDATRRLLGEAHVEGGVAVRWFDPVLRVEEGPAVVMGGDRRVEAEHVVVAAGAWTPDLLERSGLPVPVEGYTAQAAVLEWGAPDAFPVLHDAVGGFYARPEGDGKLLVGDGTRLEPRRPDLREEMGASADRAFLEEVAAAVKRRVPEAAEGDVLDHWSGVEAATPDRHPLVGPDPRLEGLHLLVGGNGFGFMRAPALGEAAASWILDGEPTEDAARFRPDRFAGEWDRDVQPREGFTLSP